MFLGTLTGQNRNQRSYRSVSPHEGREFFGSCLSPHGTAVYFCSSCGHCSGIPIAAGKPAGPTVGSGETFSDLTFEGVLWNSEEFPEKAQG
jgi:hypothetical protein